MQAAAGTNRLVWGRWPLFALIAITFFSIRAYYWSITSEQPFSDMADYKLIAEKVLHNWDFSHNSFWRSYKPPTLPIFGAVVFGIFGSDSLLAWRICMSACLLAASFWLAYEIARLSGRAWIGVALLVMIALSKASIFWSLKFSTEGPAEFFGYLCSALTLHCIRKPSTWLAFLLGGVFTAGILNRPQFLPALPATLFLLTYLAVQNRRPRHERGAQIKGEHLLSLAAGAALCWMPWLFRSYALYGAVVPLSTQGPYSFLWEIGEVTLDDEPGTTETFATLQAKAPSSFSNDYEAQRYAKRFVSSWLRKNYDKYPALVIQRALTSIEQRSIDLSRVPRETLFPNILDDILIDKSIIAVIAGVAGLLMMPFLIGSPAIIVCICSVLPWLFGMLFLSNPRVLDPSLSLLLFGNCAWAVLLCNFASALKERGKSAKRTST